MKWVTREKAKVDRIACPWLISKFIDKDAEFLFVPASSVLHMAKTQGAKSFDAEGADFTHTGNKCTFEVLVEHYNISDRAIERMAKIVHGADILEDINVTPESPGLRAIAQGFTLLCGNDNENMLKQFAVYDALYEYLKSR